MQLRFVQKPNKDSTPLRDGTVDLETGVIAPAMSPELRALALFRDRLIGVVRKGHPLSKGKITPARYASGRHICVSREPNQDPVDAALAMVALRREIAVSLVAGFSTALTLARTSDLIASVPERHTGKLRAGMFSFVLPVTLAEFTVSMVWHPRLDADPGHRWLRGLVRDVCAAVH